MTKIDGLGHDRSNSIGYPFDKLTPRVVRAGCGSPVFSPPRIIRFSTSIAPGVRALLRRPVGQTAARDTTPAATRSGSPRRIPHAYCCKARKRRTISPDYLLWRGRVCRRERRAACKDTGAFRASRNEPRWRARVAGSPVHVRRQRRIANGRVYPRPLVFAGPPSARQASNDRPGETRS
jgi:hypothetical protein